MKEKENLRGENVVRDQYRSYASSLSSLTGFSTAASSLMSSRLLICSPSPPPSLQINMRSLSQQFDVVI